MLLRANVEICKTHQTDQTQVFEARLMLERGHKERQTVLIKDELRVVPALMDKGPARAGQLSSLQPNEADRLGQVAEYRSEPARIRNSTRYTEL